MSIVESRVHDASRVGRSNSVNSIVMSLERPPVLVVAWNRVPWQIGLGDVFSTCVMRGL